MSLHESLHREFHPVHLRQNVPTMLFHISFFSLCAPLLISGQKVSLMNK
jgi:hypothetical protein